MGAQLDWPRVIQAARESLVTGFLGKSLLIIPLGSSRA